MAGPWLLYARGGYAATKVTFTGAVPTDIVHVGGPRNGWTLGGGIEYMIMRNFSLAQEYNHYGFGIRHYDGISVGGVPLHSDVAFKLDNVMLRANVRFGS